MATRNVAQGMRKILTIVAALLIAGGLAYHFAALEIFDALIPKDQDGVLWQSDMAYGPDPRQKLDIYMPYVTKGPVPMVLFVHGGSWQEGNKRGYSFVGRALAARGFMTLVINYRLHPKNRYPAFVDDVALALRWAADNGKSLGGDPDRLFAMGHSAGAYDIAMAVLDERYADHRPKLSGVVTLAGPFDFLPLDSKITIKVFGDVPDLPATQPINHVTADAPPFLILHGSADTTVYPKNAIALDKALRAKGVASELKVYEGISHVGILLAIAKPFRKTPVLEDAVSFMNDRSR
jgi:acetyl esterase/lipase